MALWIRTGSDEALQMTHSHLEKSLRKVKRSSHSVPLVPASSLSHTRSALQMPSLEKVRKSKRKSKRKMKKRRKRRTGKRREISERNLGEKFPSSHFVSHSGFGMVVSGEGRRGGAQPFAEGNALVALSENARDDHHTLHGQRIPKFHGPRGDCFPKEPALPSLFDEAAKLGNPLVSQCNA